MRVTFTRPTVADGRVVGAGETLELPDADAVLLIRMGKAVAVVGRTVGGDPVPETGPDRGAPAPADRDPKPRRTRTR